MPATDRGDPPRHRRPLPSRSNAFQRNEYIVNEYTVDRAVYSELEALPSTSPTTSNTKSAQTGSFDVATRSHLVPLSPGASKVRIPFSRSASLASAAQCWQ